MTTTATTICIKCAKDDFLRRYINENGISRGKCSLCQESNSRKFINIDEKTRIKDILKSLVRYHYSELDYNPRWGGDRIERLLSVENPIIDHTRIKLGEEDKETEEAVYPFLEDFAWPPYADDPDKGVSLYYGRDSTGRGLFLYPISDSPSEYLSWLEDELQKKNFYKLEDRALKRISHCSHLISKKVSKGEIFYRARIGFDEKKWKSKAEHEGYQIVYFPYVNDKIGAPSPLNAGEGRLNRKGISFLYTASDIETAISEIRPHPSHIISTGKFKIKKNINIISLTHLDFYDFLLSDTLIDLYILLGNLNNRFSMPILPEETSRYLVSQFYAEIFRKIGFRGVEYKSSISSGTNFCFFEAEDLEYIENSAKVKRITQLNYSFTDAKFELEPEVAEEVSYFP